MDYRIIADVDPVRQTLGAEVRVKTAGVGGDELVFCLHRDLKIASVTGIGIKGIRDGGESTFPFATEARSIVVELEDLGSQEYEIQFKYQGHLGITTDWEVNRLTPQWVELGLYTPWFPLALPTRDCRYSVDIKLPEEYKLVASGDVSQRDGFWHVEHSTPVDDCGFIAAPTLKEVRTQVGEATVVASYSSPDGEQLAQAFSQRGAEILAYFNSIFGGTPIKSVDIVIAPRLEGGGYARRGFIVFGMGFDLTDEVKIYRYIGHEFAHLWWYRADTTTWEDWLNESFAEYSALMAVRRFLGQEEYNRLLAARREKAEGLPPIKGIDRSADKAFDVLYAKGCVLLVALEEELGEPEFISFLQELIRQRAGETEKLLSILAQLSWKDAAASLENKLRQ